MVNPIDLYRKRYIPNEIIHLKDDKILIHEKNLIITKWNTLKPRNDIDHGISAYFIDKGIKVSKIFDKNSSIVYWYCDIIHVNEDFENHSIIFEDLLVDVIIYENGTVKILDLDELADALEKNLIKTQTVTEALRILNKLLEIIYSGNFYTLCNYINDVEML